MRIEVAFTSSHWDATVLARRFDLARGWERQLDLRYNGLFYGEVLTRAAYQHWLLDTGVRFVVLSDARLDPSSVAEASSSAAASRSCARCSPAPTGASMPWPGRNRWRAAPDA